VKRIPRISLWLLVVAAAATAFITWLGSVRTAVVTGAAIVAIAAVAGWWGARHRTDGPADPSRRSFLAAVGLGGAALVAGGVAVGKGVQAVTRPDATDVQEAAASDLGSEYMELVARASHPGRSGDLQLILAPFNSANYSFESMSLYPRDPRTSHASVWMYLERIPLVAYGPGVVAAGDSTARVSLADLAPTTASLVGYLDWPGEREGQALPGLRTTGTTPKVVVTFVFDGGGWNVLRAWPNDWPNLKRLMREGANFRNALTGSFPAVTACAHATIGTGTFPRGHGITGHNIRADANGARKAYGTPGQADPSDILVPTLADLWHDASGAWVGQVGYQVWHMGMLGHGGTNRAPDDLPVGVYFEEDGSTGWQPHNPALFRVPDGTPSIESLEQQIASFDDPGWDETWEQWRTQYCCVPPIAAHQGDVLEAALAEDAVGRDAPALLYTTFKSPDYTGHVYGMASKWEGLMLRAVDAELGRLVDLLDRRFPGEYVLFVTADHGQCPLPDSMDGVRLDPIQLASTIERRFGPGLRNVVQYTAPSEIYLDTAALSDAGATTDDVAAALRHLTYRENVGPYVPASAVEQDLLDKEEFAAVLSAGYIAGVGDTGRFGDSIYSGDDVDPGIPPTSLPS
jgi:predicted AlkP superfamily pyrophosphatase or phosphodiesterase